MKRLLCTLFITLIAVASAPATAKGQRGAACGASAAPTGCASNGKDEKQ